MSFDSKEVKKKAPETMFIELIDQRDSGYVLDGTRGTKHEARLSHPSAEFIPNRGFRLVKQKNQETGEIEWVQEAIRFIKNYTTLSVEEQRRRQISPAKNKLADMIIVKGGNMAVVREGAHAGLFDYLKEVFYNQSNPNRPDSAKAIFREVIIGAKEEQLNTKEFAIAEATNFLSTLVVKKGKTFSYDEPKINALCQIFLIHADSPAGKLNGLMAFAKHDPENFLNLATKAAQTLEMEIGYALELNVIVFKGNVAHYANKEKTVANVGKGVMSHDKKVKALAEILGQPEHKSILDELMIELAAAKEKN